MLELIIAALVQVAVLTSGSAPVTTTNTTKSTVQASTAPTGTTNIGTSGWDDRN